MKKSMAALAAALLAIGALALASPAAAASPAPTTAGNIAVLETPTNYLETSNEVQCGSVDITLHNVSPWLYRVLIETETSPDVWERVDGTVSGDGVYAAEGVLMVDNRGDAPDDQTGTYTVTFPEDTGVHNVRYKVSSGAESDLYVGLPVGEFTTVAVQSDCLPEYLETSNVVQCNSVDVTLKNVSPWMYRVLIETRVRGEWVRADGEASGAGTKDGVGVMGVDNLGDAPNIQTGVYTVTFPEKSGVHWLRYRVSSGTESDLYYELPVGEFTTVKVKTNCVPGAQ